MRYFILCRRTARELAAISYDWRSVRVCVFVCLCVCICVCVCECVCVFVCV